jgi:hypothetical protein
LGKGHFVLDLSWFWIQDKFLLWQKTNLRQKTELRIGGKENYVAKIFVMDPEPGQIQEKHTICHCCCLNRRLVVVIILVVAVFPLTALVVAFIVLVVAVVVFVIVFIILVIVVVVLFVFVIHVIVVAVVMSDSSKVEDC